ncbi:hypothetical protein FH972_026294 [Carpinus fangiana]|uniref:phosphopantothenoylcysteine decarboxylase n=1 Tax=Carpinus fangiana TaxID=176857 RepID=A0A5N6L3X7_9ROSI|nr:hypothetical protein FH972_026294 [Carpinus fangiana]
MTSGGHNRTKDPIDQTGAPPFSASDFVDDGKYHLLLAASGSVATIKLPNIIQGLAKRTDVSIRVLLTESSANFLQGQSDEQPHIEAIRKYPNVDAIYRDEDEWRTPWTRGAPILHIELRRWAHDMFIVPVSANTLAKLAYGLSDNLLTSVVRAWEVIPPSLVSRESQSADTRFSRRPGLQKVIYIAPAMNTAMWVHPATGEHLDKLVKYGTREGTFPWIEILRPQEKELACGDTGTGAMRDWQEILAKIESCVETHELFP